MAETSTKTKVLIVGGGFAGVRLARKLAGHADLDLTLISADNSFAYYPQLYHTASGGARTESAIPLSELVNTSRVHIVRDTLATLDPKVKSVTGQSGTTYPYDQLVLALGNVTNYFGIQGLPEFSYNIKTIEGAEKFKSHLHRQLVDEKRPDVNYVIVGGGPTGVELAAALGSYLHRIVRLHQIPQLDYEIELVEAAPRLLPRLPEAFSAKVQKRLEALGVKVLTGTVVEGETASELQLKGQKLATKTVVWTAGMANNPFFKDHAQLFTLEKNGKAHVDEHLQALPNVYVAGDNAFTQYSGMAQTAIYDADYIAADLVRAVHSQPRPVYKPKAPVSVIPVGEWYAAAQWGPVLLYGLPGYLLRRAADLIGYADIENWPKAVKSTLEDSLREDNCNICQPGSVAAPDPGPAK